MGRTGVVTALVALLAAAGCTDPEATPPTTSSAPTSSAVSSSAVSSSAAASSAVSSSSAAPSSAATVPDDLLLPDEGRRSTVVEFTDWTTDHALGRPWMLDPCRPTDYPTDRQRTRFRTVSREGPEALDARQLGVYPSAEVAADVLAGFRRVLSACATGQLRDGVRWTWVTAGAPGLGDEGFLAASSDAGPGYASHGARIAVTRVGNAVFLAYASGEYYTAQIDEGAESAREVAQRFLDSL